MFDWIPFYSLFMCSKHNEEEYTHKKEERHVPLYATLVPVTVMSWEEFVKSAK